MNKILGFSFVLGGLLFAGHWMFHAFLVGFMFIDVGLSIIFHHLSLIVSILIIIFGFYIMKK